jgi:DNA repair protein SbcD/Mre11
MPRFLHVADVHLGYDRYNHKERSLDFFYAFQDALRKYAVEAAVDFVVIAGDLFEHRTIQPATLNQAQLCLQMLQEANIPVLAIEGNHDNLPYGTKTNWLRYLADWGLLILLEPEVVGPGQLLYRPWNSNTGRGGYVDLACGVRVLGSNWYGASAPQTVQAIATAMGDLPPGPAHTILLFHHGLEGQIARYAGALRYSEILPLREAGVDYLALGHIHKHYVVENWIFNPGSVEANSVEESTYKRGVYLVNLDAPGVQGELKSDYYQRSVVRLTLKAQGQETCEQLCQAALERVEQAIALGELDPEQRPLVELRLQGQVGFDRLELNVRQLQRQLQERCGALIFLLKYEAEPLSYVSPLAEEATLEDIEREIFTDLLSVNVQYKERATPLAQGLMALKTMQAEGCPEAELYRFTQALLQTAAAREDQARGTTPE